MEVRRSKFMKRRKLEIKIPVRHFERMREILQHQRTGEEWGSRQSRMLIPSSQKLAAAEGGRVMIEGSR